MHEPDPNDTRLIMVALTKERLCAACLVVRTGVTRAHVDQVVAALGEVLRVKRVVAACELCFLTREVFKLE
jgi:hypothetical protein